MSQCASEVLHAELLSLGVFEVWGSQSLHAALIL